MKLTMKQIDTLTLGKKHWSEKPKHILSLFKSWFGFPLDPEKLEWFMEELVPAAKKRLQREYFDKSQKGIIKTKFTPTDVNGGFSVITRPVIGCKYHISWAFKGAVFKLVKIDGDVAYLDNPKHKRKELLKCKVSELRALR